MEGRSSLWVVRPAGKAVALALRRLGIDSLFEKIGLSSWMETAGVQVPPSQDLAALVRVFLAFLILLSAAETLGLERVTSVMDEFVVYRPKLLGAVIVVVVGMFLAHHSKRSVERTLEHLGVDYARSVSQVVYGVTLLSAPCLLGCRQRYRSWRM